MLLQGSSDDSFASLSTTTSAKQHQITPKSWRGNRSKSPRPERVCVIFHAIQGAFRECINITQGDIALIRESIENGLSLSSAQVHIK